MTRIASSRSRTFWRDILPALVIAVACWGASAAAVVAQEGAFCSRFDRGVRDGWGPCTAYPNVTVTTDTTGSIGGGSDSYLRVRDQAGWSAACSADPKYTGDWLKKLGGCGRFCFDVRIFEIPLAPTTVIHPSITIFGPSGSKAWFSASIPATTDAGSAPGWHHICAPIIDGPTPPSGPDGAWSVSGGTWHSIITGVTSVLVPVDFTKQPSEVVGYDNICMTSGQCGATIKVCKIAGAGIAPGTPFTFTVGSGTIAVPAGPAPGGTCVEVSDPSLMAGANATVTETIPPGVAVSGISVTPPGSLFGSPDLAAGSVTVTLGPKPTEVTYTDVALPPPVPTGCFENAGVSVACNPDGSYVVTIAGGFGAPGDTVTIGSNTAGVTISPPQQSWAPTTTWTVTGAAPGQTVVLQVTDTRIGGGQRPGTDACCSGEMKLVMPDCPKPKIDLGVEKHQIKADGQGIAFEIDVTNVGAPITFGANELTVTDTVPAGMTINSQSNPNWHCGPLPSIGPTNLTCTYVPSGSLASGAPVPDPIVLHGVQNTHEKPLTNCAVVSVPASVGIDGNPSNDRSCVTLRDPRVGELIFTKRVDYQGPAALPPQPYPIDVTCNGTTTTLSLMDGVAQSIGNIGWGATCTYTEPTPPIPPTACPGGSIGTWTTTFSPPSPLSVNAPTTHITVTNTLTCKWKDGDKVDFGIVKTGGTTPAEAPPYGFELTVTNHGAAVSSGGVITVTETVPANMTFDSIGGPGWTCTPPSGPAGTVITCVYGASVAAGEVLPPISVAATATGKPPYPPVTNCAQVGPAAGSGLVDGDASNDRSCVTVRKPDHCLPPQVTGPDGKCITPPPVCPPPMVPGPVPGQCLCPPGTTLQGDTCVKISTTCLPPTIPGPAGTCILPPPPTCRPPMVPGPIPGRCFCPPGTSPSGDECVRITTCKPPLVPGPRPGLCVCPDGTTLQNGECVRITVCKPPMVPGPRPGQCVCPDGTTLQNGECVRITVCKPPMVPGPRPGQCMCREGTTLRGGDCVKVTTCRPPMVPGRRPGQCLCPTGLEERGGRCVERVERPRPQSRPGVQLQFRPDVTPRGTPVPFDPFKRRDEGENGKLRR